MNGRQEGGLLLALCLLVSCQSKGNDVPIVKIHSKDVRMNLKEIDKEIMLQTGIPIRYDESFKRMTGFVTFDTTVDYEGDAHQLLAELHAMVNERVAQDAKGFVISRNIVDVPEDDPKGASPGSR